MSKKIIYFKPSRPSDAAYQIHGLTMALVDLIEAAGCGEVQRREFLKSVALARAAELASRELAHWFGSRMGKDHDLLEALQDRYVEEPNNV